MIHDDLDRLLLLLLHHHLFQQSDGRVVVDVLVTSQGVASVESLLALVAVEWARVAVYRLDVVALHGLRLERSTADLA